MSEDIRAEIVAQVREVVARLGQLLAEGDPVVILESMKMEIPVLAEGGGTLTSIAVRAGDVVKEGDLIATVE
ncbi:MAG: biotin/lipoyl-binding carrier protein [Actinophytocola sp.]|nr:biotin/lipoyl-binding carrier protein [Actinophytocola sp.]